MIARSNPVRWGVIDTSGWADHTFPPAIKPAGGVLLRGIGSQALGSGNFAREHGAPRSDGSGKELLNDGDVEAISVASPSHLHCEHAVAALRHGKHVLVEKPIAATVDAGEQMVKPAESRPEQATAGTVRSSVEDVGYRNVEHELYRGDWVMHVRELHAQRAQHVAFN